ncbi:MAG: hypothetical protein AAF730_14355 [Bacteroidota bacterium]
MSYRLQDIVLTPKAHLSVDEAINAAQVQLVEDGTDPVAIDEPICHASDDHRLDIFLPIQKGEPSLVTSLSETDWLPVRPLA